MKPLCQSILTGPKVQTGGVFSNCSSHLQLEEERTSEKEEGGSLSGLAVLAPSRTHSGEVDASTGRLIYP